MNDRVNKALRDRAPPAQIIADFNIKEHRPPRSELEEIFFAGDGRLVHKWVHYLEIYETHFARFRDTPVRMLEIGVFQGGSLDMWRHYFGDRATLFGVDIDPKCAEKVTPPNQVRIGSQADPDFLRQVVEEMGGVDIVLDDGSHRGADQWTSYRTLFPLLAENGLYAIEDLQTSYWAEDYEGGFGKRDTGIGLIKSVIDEIHGWYHEEAENTLARDWAYGVHAYDGIAVIEKRRKERPGHIMIRPRWKREAG